MRLILAGLTTILAATASAQITRNGAAYLFRIKHQVGSTATFGVVSTIGGVSANGQPMKFTMPMVWKTVAVKGGVATIDTTVGPVSLGKEPMMNATKNRIQIDSRGQLVGKAGTGQQVSPSLPAQPIKVGQSWSASAPIEMPGQGPKKISATYTFKGIKTIAGKPFAELAIKTSGQANGTGTMLLFMSDGTLFRSTMNMTLQMTSPTGTISNYKVTADITRK